MDKCPNCKAWLETIQVQRTVIGEWDYETNSYVDNGQGTTVYRCYTCGHVLASVSSSHRDTDGIPIGADDL